MQTESCQTSGKVLMLHLCCTCFVHNIDSKRSLISLLVHIWRRNQWPDQMVGCCSAESMLLSYMCKLQQGSFGWKIIYSKGKDMEWCGAFLNYACPQFFFFFYQMVRKMLEPSNRNLESNQKCIVSWLNR